MHDHNDHRHHHASVPADGSADEVAMCPVMHMQVNKQEAEDSGLKRTYDSKEYYFCCNGCAADFDKDPARYAH